MKGSSVESGRRLLESPVNRGFPFVHLNLRVERWRGPAGRRSTGCRTGGRSRRSPWGRLGRSGGGHRRGTSRSGHGGLVAGRPARGSARGRPGADGRDVRGCGGGVAAVCRSRSAAQPSMIEDYKAIVRAQLLPVFGAIPLESVTTEAIERWMSSLSGAAGGWTKALVLLHAGAAEGRKRRHLRATAPRPWSGCWPPLKATTSTARSPRSSRTRAGSPQTPGAAARERSPCSPRSSTACAADRLRHTAATPPPHPRTSRPSAPGRPRAEPRAGRPATSPPLAAS